MARSIRDYFGAIPVEGESDFTTLAQIRERLDRTPELFEWWKRLASVSPKPSTEWGSDQEATQWWRTEMSITSALHHAGDSINSLRELIAGEHHAPLPYIAHFAVARSGLEASSLAVWLLAPDDPRERINRHIREIWREVLEENKLYTRAIKISASDPEYELSISVDSARKDRKRRHNKYKTYIRAIAKANNLEDPTQRDYAVSFREICGKAAAAAGLTESVGEMVWSELSSLSHPSTLRSLRSNLEVLSESDENGMMEARVSTSIPTIGLAVYANLRIFRHALELVQARKIRPTKSP